MSGLPWRDERKNIHKIDKWHSYEKQFGAVLLFVFIILS